MANPTIDISKSRSLTNAIKVLITPEPFVIKTVFKNADSKPHSADTFDCEKMEYGAKLATFVSDHGEPAVIGKGTRSVQQIKIPRTYEKKIFTVQELADYTAVGNIYGDEASKAAARNNWVLDELQDLKNRVIRRREWMAIKALTLGKITVTADDETWEADYGYTANQLVDLTGSAVLKWNGSAPKIAKDIKDWKKKISQRSGMPANLLLLGENAASDFITDTTIQTTLDANNKRAGVMELTNVPTIGATYLGRVFGIDCYEVNQQFLSSGTATNMFGDNLAVMLATGSEFRNHVGPIYRIENNTARQQTGMEFFVETLVNPQRTFLEWNCEQKSLPAIHDVGAVIAATVHS